MRRRPGLSARSWTAAVSANVVFPAPGVATAKKSGPLVFAKRSNASDCHGRSRMRVGRTALGALGELLLARGGLLREGLAFDRCQVAIVTNMGAGDHLGLNYITTVD